MHKSTIVFDLDGTLADTIHDLVGALNHTLETVALPPFASSDVAHLTGKGGLRAMIAHAFDLAQRPLDPQLTESLFARTAQHYSQNIAVETLLYPGAHDALQSCAAQGWRLAVCTNKPAGQARQLLAHLKIDHMFDAVTGADSFAFKKPDPRHLTRTIQMAGGATDRAVMVGDTITDIRAARNAGTPVIAVDFGYSDVDVRSLEPDRTVSHFDALYAAACDLLP